MAGRVYLYKYLDELIEMRHNVNISSSLGLSG